MINDIQHKLLEDYWKSKIKDKEVLPSEGEALLATERLLISTQQLSYFRKITREQPLAEYAVFLTLYILLLKRYFRDFEGTIFSADSFAGELNGSTHPVLFTCHTAGANSFKEALSIVSSELMEVRQYAEYDPILLHRKLGEKRFDQLTPFGISGPVVGKLSSPAIHFELRIEKMQQGDIAIGIQYSPRFADKHIAEGVLNNYRQWLTGMDAYVNTHPGQLPILTNAAREQVLQEFNNTARSYPEEATIVSLFEEQVRSHPDEIALMQGDTVLTYGELNKKANQFAHYLVNHYKLGADDVIGILLPKSAKALVAILAVLKTGAAYLPIDMQYPEERIRYIIRDSQLKLIVAETAAIQEGDIECVMMDGWEVSDGFDSDLQLPVSPGDLAYVIYTSGSTGVPKGVMVEHRSNVNMSLEQIRQFGISAADRVVWFASVSFDASVSEIMMALYSGACLLIPPGEILKDPALFGSYLRTSAATVVTFPPSYLDLVSDEDLAGMRCVIEAGEAAHVQRSAAIAQRIACYNAYGPTECAVCTSIYKVTEGDSDRLSIPIGKPIANLSVYILDEQLQPLPVGVCGNIYVAGVGVARGYIHNPALTAEKFVWDPFVSGSRMYDTGDLGKWLPDGNIEFLGRRDEQVKIRGYRIEPGEIETALLRGFHAIQQSVVVAGKVNNAPVLIAYYVASAPIDKASLRLTLLSTLPEYMIPAFFVHLPALPLTPNGKVNKKALPAVRAGGIREGYVAPSDEQSKKLLKIWQDVLGTQEIGVTDDLFEWGGNSITATRIAAAIRSELLVDLPLKHLFTHATVAALSTLISNQDKAASLSKITAQHRKDRLPLSFSQERLWLIHRIEGSSHYHIPVVVKLEGELDWKVLSAAFSGVVNRHEVLRSVIEEKDGAVYQRILEEGQYPLELIEDNSNDLNGIIYEFASRPFDLSGEHLLRTRLIKRSSHEHILVMVMHHIIADGWSMPLLVNELIELYQSAKEQRPAILPALSVQYADYAIWQRHHLQGELLDRKLSYWKNKLAGVTSLELPTDFSRPAAKSVKGNTLHFTIPNELKTQLEELSKREGVTLFMTLLAAFKVLLYRYSGQEDISVGVPVANRDRQEIESLIGFFVNTVILRSDLGDNPVFKSLLARVKDTTLEAYEHQDTPFEKVVDAVGALRELNRTALFQVLFVLQNNAGVSQSNIGDVHFSTIPFELGTSRFDLSCSMTETAEGLSADIQYRPDLFRKDTIERMHSHYAALLSAVVIDPWQRIGALAMLDPKEEQQLISQYNDVLVTYPASGTIVDLFDAKAIEVPEATAVVFEGKTLTYAEIRSQSDRLARHLITQGVGKDSLVLLCIGESMEMTITAILGILKAGAAYVPLDPDYPQERIDYIIADISASMAVTDSIGQALLHGKPLTTILVDQALPEPKKTPLPAIEADQLIYVIYTSGSTGTPKGVMITHQNIMDYVHGLLENTDLGESRSFGLMSTIATDLGNTVLYPAMATGGALHLFRKDTLTSPPLLHTYFHTHAIDCIKIVPSYWKSLELNGRILLPARMIIFGGEALPAGILKSIYAAAPDIKIVNHYGPTETTIGKLLHKVDPHGAYEIVPIGKPFSDTKIFIVDRNGALCPVGVPGELLIGGAGVAKGYLNRDALTREQFIINPFDKDTNKKLYKTGDWVRRRADGNIEFLGRVDDQVKIRGYRVEPGEITAVLNSCPLLDQGIVVAREDAGGHKRLIAFIVAVGRYDREGILAYLKQRLPDYMVPSLLVELSALPLTSNGKVDKKALPDPDLSVLVSNEYEAPGNEIEEQLVMIWQELLHAKRIGIHDNFFELGGDSIISIQVVSRASRYGLTLHPRDIFECQTIATLAAKAKEEQEEVSAEQGMLTGEAALLPIQRWFLELDYDHRSHYNQSQLLSIDKAITITQLSHVWKALILQHDALRFAYERSADDWIQRYSDRLSALEEMELKGSITALCDDYQSSLDIEKGLLIKGVLIKTPSSERYNRLLLVIHHLAVDGVSWRILLEQFQTALKMVVAGDAIHLGKKSTSYRQWADALKAYAVSPIVTSQLAYWEEVISHYTPLPVDRAGNNTAATRVHHTVQLDKDLTRSLLLEVNNAYNTEINDILLSALSKTLSAWTGSSKVLIGLEGHGREFVNGKMDTSNTVGWFTSLYPLLLNTEDLATPADHIRSIKEQLRHVPQKGIGYGLLRYLHPENHLSEGQWDIVFNYLGQADNVVSPDTWIHSATETTGSNIGSSFPFSRKLDINSIIRDGVLTLHWNYSHEQYDAQTITKLSASFIHHLSELIVHCRELGEREHTPSDYGLVPEVGYKELSLFLNKLGRDTISDIYRLSPLQQGMLFHYLYDKDGKAYVEQLRMDFPQGIDLNAFAAAWEDLLTHHTILRSGFFADSLSIPVQVVFNKVNLPFEVLDYSYLSEEEQETHLTAFLAADLQRGFNFQEPPLMRITLIRLSEQLYKMVWTHYHIILDGWSNTSLIASFQQAYAAYSRGRTPQSRPKDQYGDYIRYIAGTDHHAAMSFWKNYMSNLEQKTLLPFAANVSDHQRNKGGAAVKHEQLLFGPVLTKQVREYCQQHQITVNTFVQGIWSLLLSRYTGNNDVVFGVVVSGRPSDLAASERRVGLYINNLPLRSRIAEDELFVDWVRSLQKEHTEARRYQYTSLNEIQRWVGLNGEPFDTILVFENYPKMDTEEAPLLSIGKIELEERTNYLLTVTAVDQEPGLRIDLGYNSALLDKAYVEMIRGHIEVIVPQLLRVRDIKIANVSILTDKERQQLLTDFNNTLQSYPQDITVVTLFEEQVERNGEQPALVYGEHTITFRELDVRANQVAHYLRTKGVKQEALVAVCMDQSIDMMVSIWAIMKAGAAYVPLDPAYPMERIAYMMEDTRAAAVITTENYAHLFDEERAVVLDKEWSKIEQGPLVAPYRQISIHHLAYVIYTSGSTGQPKGVAITHQSLNNYIAHAIAAYSVEGAHAGSYIHLPPTFDAAITAFYVPLLVGKYAVIADRKGLDAFTDPNLVRYAPYDFIKLTPSHMTILGNSVEEAQLKGLTYKYVLGGEALHLKDVEFLSDKGISVDIINEYGPTEATVGCSVYTFNTGDQLIPTDAGISIGRPIPNTSLYILDVSGRPVPVGVSGELYIGGAGLATGYLHRPQLTSEKFITNPFGEGRLYRTGDVARWLTDGNIEYLGRMDDQVKIRGYRIELGEVTAVLNNCPLLDQGIVIAHEDGNGHKRLIAYVVAAVRYDRNGMLDYLKAHLPDYMVPSLLVELSGLPLTSNGKIDKKALPDPDVSALASNEYVGPRNATEERLVTIWQELLHAKRIGIYDNFFELGGDSIISIQVVSRASRYGLTLHPRDIFESQTIAVLSAKLQQEQVSTAAEQGELSGTAELLPIQQWFLEQEYDSRSHYNQSQLLSIDKAITFSQLSQVFKALVLQHDALRFSYQQTGAHWMQRYSDTLPVLEEVVLKENITDICTRYQSSLDVVKGQLIKGVLINTPSSERHNRLLLVVHHLAVDGVSWRILLEQFQTALSMVLVGDAINLGRKSSSYRQWGDALKAYAVSPHITGQLSYWEDVIAHYTPLPVDRSGHNTAATRVHHSLQLDRELTRSLLLEVNTAYNTDINDLLLSALAKTLCAWTGESKLLVGIEGHGREYISHELDTSKTVGWFTSLYPLLLDAGDIATPGDQIRSIKEQLRNVPQKGLGYGLLRYLHPEKSLSAGQWDIVFNYLGQTDNVLEDDALLEAATEDMGAVSGAGWPFGSKLDISGVISDGLLNMRWSYSHEQYNAQTIAGLSASFIDNLRELIVHCRELSEKERTPSDYGLAPEVGYKELSLFLDTQGRDQISDIFRISPLQKGMLFHYLYDKSTSYLEQVLLDFPAGIDIAAFTDSWSYILHQHTALRAAFIVDVLSIPVQVIHKQVEMPFALLDYSHLNKEEQDAALSSFLESDFRQGFDLQAPPLMRITLIRLNSKLYRMVWTRYHIVLDGWSNSVLIGEFLQAYTALVKGNKPAVREEDNYGDYIRYIAGIDHHAAAHFWKNRMAGFSKSLLPFAGNIQDHERNKGDGKVRHEFLRMSPALTEDLKQYCQGQQITMNTLIQGVWSLLLGRYTGSRDIGFGVVVSGRPEDLPHAEERVGLFINNLPLRVSIEPDQTVGSWLRKLQNDHTDARRYQYVSLNDIQHWTGLKGDLFDSVLVFDNYPKAKYKAEEQLLKAEGLHLKERRNYLLSLSVSLREQLVIDFAYNSDLLQSGYARMIKGHFEQVFNHLLNVGEERVADIKILTSAEEERLLVEFNDTTTEYPSDKTIVDVFEEQVGKTPDQTALIYKGEALTYQELNERADRLAHYLRTVYALQADDLVGIMMDRSIWSVVAILGVLKAGAAYVPIDITYPLDRKSYIINDTGLKVLIIESSSMFDTMDLQVSILPVDLQFDDFEKKDVYKRDYEIKPTDLAYVIYTSGSTGLPKGVMIEHTSNVNMSLDQIRKFGVTANDRVLQFASLSFDASVSEIFMAFYCGATLVLIPEAVIADANSFLTYIKEHSISVITFPPVYLQTLDRRKMPALRAIVTAGEAAIVADALYYAGIGGYYNAYGPTECAVCVSTYAVDKHADIRNQIPVGKPLANMKVFIVDTHMQLVPIGVEGHLYVSGAGLARGYLHRPALTAEKFIANPFGEGRLYKTGDVARWLPDGNIEFLGRVDDQVKIRGYRIELGEVNVVLNSCPLLDQGIVIAREDGGGHKRLIAYIVATGRYDREAIQAYLKQRLPDYMVPALLMELSALPVTTNGKIDKKALPDPEVSVLTSNEYEAPRNETEERLVTIWQELLHTKRIGIHDNFFELGGDSIISIQVVSRASRYGLTLHPQDLFEGQTIAVLAAKLQEEQTNNAAEQGVLTGEAALLPIQQWFLDQDYDSRSHYNQSQLLSIDKEISIIQLSHVLKALVSQHDALRFRYEQLADAWVQRYSDTQPEMEEVVLAGSITDVCDIYQRSLDIEKGYLIKGVLINTPSSERHNRLLLVIHHLAVDGVSWRILLEQFHAALKMVLAGDAIHLGKKSTSYRQWADALKAYAVSPIVTSQLAYWEEVISHYTPLPVDRAGNNTAATRVHHTVQLDRDLTRSLLLEVNSAYNTEINDILLSALSMTLSTWTGSSKVLLGMEGHGREYISHDLDTSKTVGWFTSLYPILLDTGDIATGADQIRSIKEQLRHVPQKGLGYGLLRYLHPDKRLSGGRWDIVFNYLGQTDNVLEDDTLLGGAQEHMGDTTGAGWPYTTKLDISGIISEGMLTVRWSYSHEQYDTQTIASLSAAFIDHLGALIGHCRDLGERERTPSDYGLAPEVGYKELSRFLDAKGRDKISDLYRLSPLQKGILFHHLYDEDGKAYMEQLRVDFPEGIDLVAFRAAWEDLLKHHTILRSGFFADALSIPVQCVFKEVSLPFEVLDYSYLSTEEQEAHLTAFLAADLQRGFNFQEAPLMRITLIRLSERLYKMVWTHYHIILDGWSNASLIASFQQAYAAYSRGGAPVGKTIDHYGDYIRYITRTDYYAAMSFWKTYMSDISNKTLLPFVSNISDHHRNKGGAAVKHEQLLLAPVLTEQVRSYCQQHQITVNTFVQGIWSILLSKYTGSSDVVFGVVVSGRPSDLPESERRVGLYINNLPLRSRIAGDELLIDWLRSLQKGHTEARRYQYSSLNEIQQWIGLHGEPFDTIVVFENYPKMESPEAARLLPAANIQLEERTNYLMTLTAVDQEEGLRFDFGYNSELLAPYYSGMIKGHFESTLLELLKAADKPMSMISILARDEQQQLITAFNDTAVDYAREMTIVDLFEAQVEKTPDHIALVFEGKSLTYKELNEKANQLAWHLKEKGVKERDMVAICIDRSLDMMIGLLGILKSGGAYIPLDPTYPVDRLIYMLGDSEAEYLLVNNDTQHILPADQVKHTLNLDEQALQQLLAGKPGSDIRLHWKEQPLAYVIYTSGSTGRPKGVMIHHRNVTNFFVGLDIKFGKSEKQETWLAVTSISFDISVLELFWTLTNGKKVVILPDRPVPMTERTVMDFSLFYFAAQEEITAGNKYRLLLEGAKFADNNGLEAVWIPERHFHSFGDQFPNPSVAAAAVAALTNNIRIRSGSVVLPLHDPIRVAEEWSMVDNLSNGRVELSVASGWHPNDFVFMPEDYKTRHQKMKDKLVTLHQLWNGETVLRKNGAGNDFAVTIHPKPVQSSLPIWLTAAGNPETFKYAGSIGANVLTHLLGQSIEDLGDKISQYRAALAANGFDPEQGRVAVMLHTFVGDDLQVIKETVKEPFKNYLRHSIDLLKPVVDQAGLDPETDLEVILEMGFQRYFYSSGLFGTPETCLSRIRELHAAGVNEVACLIDFGIDVDITLAHLPFLKKLQDLIKQLEAQKKLLAKRLEKKWAPEELMQEHGVTHMQCTPSFARELVTTTEGQLALQQMEAVLVGGEALPVSLTRELFRYMNGSIFNMYGPTETTIWSTIKQIIDPDKVTIGTPIANTQIYILDTLGHLTPVGVAGELCIGGEGVAVGYLKRPGLTAEKFFDNPYRPGEKVYRTGDLARWLPDGEIECLGRIDDQVKISGHRIEMGEIETIMKEFPHIHECVVVKKEDANNNKRLVGYVVPGPAYNKQELQEYMRSRLPAYMIPSFLLTLEKLPLTPNGKIDKKALPDPADPTLYEGHYEAPANETEEQLANIWATLLKMKKVSIRDNFFDLGGNSFMAIQIITLIGNTLKVKISIKDLFEHPTIEALARLIDAQERKFENSLLLAPVSDSYPLTEIQKAYWLASQQDNVSVSYNTTLGWNVKAAIDLDKIASAYTLLLDRHEILRYIIDYDEKGELRFYLQDPAQTAEGFIFLDMANEPVDEKGAIRLFDEENKFLFDFRKGPLMRIKIIRNTPAEYFIFFNTHHIISDPFSLQIIFNDLLLSYHYLQQGRSGVLQPVPKFSFKDYSWSQATQAREEDQLKSENFWRTYLSGRQLGVRLPGARSLPAASNQAGVVKLVINEAGWVNTMRTYNRERQGTMFVMLLSLVKTLIYLETGQQDLSFGCPVNSRNNHELSNIVGLFLNTIIVRTIVAADPGFDTIYEIVKDATVFALAHSEYPYLKLAVLEGAETGKGGGEFNIGFNLNPKVPTRNINYPGFDFKPLQKEERYVKADIWFDITELEDAVSFEVSYRKEVFEESYISTLLDKLKYLIGHCLADSQLSLSSIQSLVAADEKQAKDSRMKHQRESNIKKLKKHL